MNISAQPCETVVSGCPKDVVAGDLVNRTRAPRRNPSCPRTVRGRPRPQNDPILTSSVRGSPRNLLLRNASGEANVPITTQEKTGQERTVGRPAELGAGHLQHRLGTPDGPRSGGGPR